MDSAALLDILGNENRRRILRLLSQKSCYVTEISEYLGVSPKAVIDHLRKLEEAGLVESHTDDNRRKYFRIAQNLRLEVNVSPYSFGAKSAYPASATLDITSCRHLSLNVRYSEETTDPIDLAAELQRLTELEHELSLAQRWVQGRLTDVHDRIAELVDDDVDSRLYADVLAALADDHHTPEAIGEQIDVAEHVVEDALSTMIESGLLRRTEDGWEFRD